MEDKSTAYDVPDVRIRRGATLPTGSVRVLCHGPLGVYSKPENMAQTTLLGHKRYLCHREPEIRW